MTDRTVVDEIYAKLVNEEDARVCRDIPDGACREVPQNFVLIIASYVLTKTGDAIANPKTTLTWMMDAIGAPVSLTGLLGPVREAGSPVSQLVIAAAVRRRPVRKWARVVGSVFHAAAAVAVAAAAWFASGMAAGVVIVISVACFSLARGLSSVPARDVVGMTSPKTRRGQVDGFSASAAGLATFAVGAGLVAVGADDGNRTTFAALLAGAALSRPRSPLD